VTIKVPRRDAAPIDPLVEVIGQIARGRESAFSDFYVTLSGRVYGLVNRVLQNTALSAEVTQDVFVELWAKADRYDEALGSVLAWVFTIAHRRAVDQVRHEERSHRRDTRYTQDNPTIDTTDVDDHVARQLEAKRVRLAMEHLTERQRQAVRLSYFDGYSNLEMAALLGIPVSTVKTRIRDGLIKLRVALDDHDRSTGTTDE